MLIISGLSNWILLLYTKISFAHAEFRKYIPQDLVVGDLSSRDFGEEEEAVADVAAEEVAWEVLLQSVTDSVDGAEGVAEGFVVAEVCHDHAFGLRLVDAGSLGQFVKYGLLVEVVLGGDAYAE